MGLCISMKSASSELAKSPISNAITRLAMQVAMAKRQENLPVGPSIDVTFLLPGEYEAPPFTGMRMGGYTKENETLLFETAVPKHILNSIQAPDYVAVVMQDVVTHADEFFRENQINFNLDLWQSLVGNLINSCTPSGISH